MTDTYIKKDIVGKADSVAVIGIGSNSIRYAAGRNGKKLVITTRLGSGLAQTGRLDEERMEKSISVISALASNAVIRDIFLSPMRQARFAMHRTKLNL